MTNNKTDLSDNLPLVSVIITVYNRKKDLPRAIRSIQRQTYRNLEIIVIDDASSDGSEAVAKHLAQKDPRIHVLQNPKNIGTYASRNQGLLISRGKFITFQDSDDLSHAKRIERQVNALIHNTTGMFSTCQMHRYGTTMMCHVSLMIRRQVLEDIGYFDSNIRVAGDCQYFQRLFLFYEKVDFPTGKCSLASLKLLPAFPGHDRLFRHGQYYRHVPEVLYYPKDSKDSLTKLFAIGCPERLRYVQETFAQYTLKTPPENLYMGS